MFFYCFARNPSDLKKRQYNKIFVCKKNLFFDEKIIKEIVGKNDSFTDDEIDKALVQILERLNKFGITAKFCIQGDSIYIYYATPDSVINRDGSNPFNLNKDLLTRLQQVHNYNSIIKDYAGNLNDTNVFKLRNQYKNTSHRDLKYFFIKNRGYKKSVFLIEEQVPIFHIKFCTTDNEKIDEGFFKTQINGLVEYNFVSKMLNYMFGMPCFITNIQNNDVNGLVADLQSKGYIHSSVVKKVLVKQTVDQKKRATILYILDLQKKYKVQNIIIHGEFLSRQQKIKITNFLNYFIKNNIASLSQQSINKVLQNMEFSCQQIQFVQTKNYFVNVHIWVEHHFYKDIIENLYFKNYELKSIFHWPMLFNIVIGGPLEEENLQKFMVFLEQYSGTRPVFNQYDDNGRILIFDRGPKPEKMQWLKDIAKLKDKLICLSPVQMKWFCIKKKPWTFFIAPFLNICFNKGSFANNIYSSQLELEFSSKILTHSKKEFALKKSISLNLGPLASFIFRTPESDYKKLLSNELNFSLSTTKDLPLLGLMDIHGAYQYCHSKFFPAINIDKENLSKEDIKDFNKKMKEPLRNIHFFTMTFKKYLLNSNKRKIFLKSDPMVFFDHFSFDGWKVRGLGAYTTQIDNFFIFANLTVGICNSKQNINGCIFDQSDFRTACSSFDKEYADKIFVLRFITAHQFFNSAQLIGMKIFSIYLGFISNLAVINTLNFDQKHILFGNGIIFMFEFFGSAFFISFGFSLQKDGIKIGFDAGLLHNVNPCEAERMSNSTTFSA